MIEPLSKTEHEILVLISTGMSNKQIAQHRFISIWTVKYHVANILAKMEVQNRTEAAYVYLTKPKIGSYLEAS